MALLWSDYLNIKSITSSGNPSPTSKRYIKDFAQNIFRTIKGPSLFISSRRSLRGSMTVEAALVFPVFLLFFLNLASIMEIIRLHGNLQFALWGIGNETALYECIVGEEGAGSLLSSIYIKGRMVDNLGREYLEQSPLKDGVSGLSVLAKPLQNDILDVTVSYSASPLSGFIGFPVTRLSNRYYGHLWNGYDVSGNSSDTQKNEMVYMTDNGSVYHVDRNCTHLLLSVETVNADTVGQRRNQWGRSYGPCEKCARGERPSGVYITQEGECFHYSSSCPGLKRTVYAVQLTDVQGVYRPCSRCGN